jgi:hypothetical protein
VPGTPPFAPQPRQAPEIANAGIAERLEELAILLEQQGADRFHVRAWRRAAEVLRGQGRPAAEILAEQGLAGLVALPAIGETIARAIATLVTHGRLPMLDRLRGAADPLALLRTVPGVGPRLARRIHDELGVASLEDLELAAFDGRLESIAALRGKRLAGIRASLAQRLARLRLPQPLRPLPPVAELLDVDREYRERAARGELPVIAPRRFNPTRAAWLPVLHTRRGARRYTALYSNTARAHALGRTRDWVVLYLDDGRAERPCTVITAARGPLGGRRVVAGREADCRRLYAQEGPARTRRTTAATAPPSRARDLHFSEAVASPRGAGSDRPRVVGGSGTHERNQDLQDSKVTPRSPRRGPPHSPNG